MKSTYYHTTLAPRRRARIIDTILTRTALLAIIIGTVLLGFTLAASATILLTN